MRGIYFVVTILAVYALYEFIRFRALVAQADVYIARAVPYVRSDGDQAMLFLGDSLGVGVGADRSEDTLAGRTAQVFPDRALENYSVSGARIRDIEMQLKGATREHYTLVVLQIGANDIIRFESAEEAARELESVLRSLATRADKVIFLSAGNIGAAKLFPYIIRPFYHMRTLAYHRAFETVAEKTGTTYINLYASPKNDPFSLESEIYLSQDGLHPSSRGYGLWFERLEKIL